MSGRHLHRIAPRHVLASAAVIVSAAALAACSGSSPTASSAASASAASSAASVAASAAATPAPTVTEAPSVAASSEASANPTAIDPCQLVTADEASALSGATYSAGTETTSGGANLCTYGGTTFNIFTVTVGQAPDEATAQAGETQFVSQLQQVAANGLTVTQLPGFASNADAATIEGTVSTGTASVSVSAIYVLRGTTFFGLSDVVIGGSAPSGTDMQAQATTVLGRLP